MTLHDLECCAIQEIGGLRYQKNPEEAIESFCRETFGSGCRFHSRVEEDVAYSFYLFTSAVSKDGSAPFDGTRFYARELHAYIKANGFGEVWESPVRVNEAFHPDHGNQVYIWMPNTPALKAWWRSRKPFETTSRLVGAVGLRAYQDLVCDTCYTRAILKTMMVVTTEKDGMTGRCIDCLGDSAHSKAFLKTTKINGWVPLTWVEGGWVCASTRPFGASCHTDFKSGEHVLIQFRGGERTGKALCSACIERQQELVNEVILGEQL